MDRDLKKGFVISISLALAFLVLSVGLLAFYFYTNLYPFSKVIVNSKGRTQLEVSVQTRVPTKVKVEYGTSDIYFNETGYTLGYRTQHNKTVSGLLPNKQHFVRVVAYDESGKEFRSKVYVL